MKKIGIIIGLILSFIIIYLLQANFFAWFNLAGVKPNLFIIIVLVTGLFAGRSLGGILGIFLGLTLDFFIGKSVGVSALMLGVVGFVGGHLNKSFSKNSRITIITIIWVTTVIYESGIIILNYFINQSYINIWYIIKTVLIESIYNSIITIIIYPLILQLGYKIERTFKENKIFTKYF